MNNTDKTPEGISRRDFMKAAGVTAAGLLVSNVAKSPAYAVAPGRVIGANDRINIVHIGVGGMGGGHINHVRELSEKANVQSIAVCDVWDKRRFGAAAAIKADESKSFRDYKKLLEAIKDADAAIIATPEHWHAEIARDCMEAGLHCYIEKPMCRTMEDIKIIEDAIARTKKTVQIGSQGCSDAKWRTAGEQIAKGKIGKVVLSQGGYTRNTKEGEWNYGIDPEANPDNLDWKMWLGKTGKQIPWTPEHYFRWRKWSRYSAGILSDLFPHRLHPLMIATGAQYPEQVTCVGSIVAHPDRDVADTTQLLVKYPDGSQMILVGSTANEQGLQDMIRGHKATIYFGGGKVEIRPERPYSDEIDQEDVPIIGPGESQQEHHLNWYDCIRTGKTPNCPIDLAAKVQTVVTLAEMSWHQNKTMNFDPIKRKIKK